MLGAPAGSRTRTRIAGVTLQDEIGQLFYFEQEGTEADGGAGIVGSERGCRGRGDHTFLEKQTHLLVDFT
jgi:hypothetical protein